MPPKTPTPKRITLRKWGEILVERGREVSIDTLVTYPDRFDDFPSDVEWAGRTRLFWDTELDAWLDAHPTLALGRAWRSKQSPKKR